jgi:hypothetical protein
MQGPMKVICLYFLVTVTSFQSCFAVVHTTLKYQYVSFSYGAESTDNVKGEAWPGRGVSVCLSLSGALPQRSDSPDARPLLPKYAAG